MSLNSRDRVSLRGGSHDIRGLLWGVRMKIRHWLNDHVLTLLGGDNGITDWIYASHQAFLEFSATVAEDGGLRIRYRGSPSLELKEHCESTLSTYRDEIIMLCHKHS